MIFGVFKFGALSLTGYLTVAQREEEKVICV